MSQQADIHLVVPTTGERLDLLKSCIASLLAQTQPVRITVVTRGDVATLRGLLGDYDLLSVVAERGSGISAAINQGWVDDDWSSDFTGWLGDDDALPPSSIEDAVERLRRAPESSMVHGWCLVVDADNRPRTLLRNGAIGAFFVGYGMNLLAQPGSLFRTACVRRVGGLDESLRYAMDVDLFMRLKTVGPIASSPRQLGVFRAHSSGLSTTHRYAAYRESRMVMRTQRRRHASGLADVVVWPTTLAVSRITRLLPGKSSCWLPP